MKNVILYSLFVFFSTFLKAQQPVIKPAIIGKWQIVSVTIPNTFYYNFANDSIFSLRTTEKITPQREVRNALIQEQFKKQMKVTFTKNGKPQLLIFTCQDSVLTAFRDSSTLGYAIIPNSRTTFKINDEKGTILFEYKASKEHPELYPIEWKIIWSEVKTLLFVLSQDGGSPMKMEYAKIE